MVTHIKLPLIASRRMVIACHYDSLANPTGFLGAVDSAVPCAMMINLATVLHQDLKLTKAKVRTSMCQNT
jgi:glutaminyl-peptide cyclotransferase